LITFRKDEVGLCAAAVAIDVCREKGGEKGAATGKDRTVNAHLKTRFE
jgi:hypothetical protein